MILCINRQRFHLNNNNTLEELLVSSLGTVDMLLKKAELKLIRMELHRSGKISKELYCKIIRRIINPKNVDESAAYNKPFLPYSKWS